MKYYSFPSGQIFHANSNSKFYILNVSEANVKSIAETTDYIPNKQAEINCYSNIPQ